MDQHAFMTIDPKVQLTPGDIVALSLSHPCTAFDKIRLLPVIDDDHNVVDGVLTYF
jgi:D-serine dehydratase